MLGLAIGAVIIFVIFFYLFLPCVALRFIVQSLYKLSVRRSHGQTKKEFQCIKIKKVKF